MEEPVREEPVRERRSSGTDARQSGGGRGLAVHGAAVVVAVAPLMIGSGPPWAQLIASALAFAAAGLFVVSRSFSVRSIPFALPAALAVAMTALQLLPWPAPLVRLLSPLAFELRTEAAGRAASFLPLTLDVPATVIEVCKGMACLALLLIVGNGARRASRARPLVFALAFVGGVVASIHVVQRLLGADSILGLYPVRDLPGLGFFGTFVNANQACSVLTLSALVAGGLALQSDGPLRIAALASAFLSAGVVLTTGSRAGILGLGIGIFLFSALVLSRRFGAGRGIALSLALALVMGGGTLWASQSMRKRIAATATDHRNDLKVRGWVDSLKVVRAYPWVGVGRGAFEAPASGHRSDNAGVRLTFPENIALQTTSEWGIPFALVLLGLVLVATPRLARTVPRLEPTTQAAACGVAAILCHELADFGLELPGVAFPTVAALGLVVARGQQLLDPKRDEGRRLSTPWVLPAMAGWAVALAAAGWALPRTLIADGARGKALVIKKDPAAPAMLAAAIRRHPADYYLELLAANVAIETGDQSVGRHLNRAQRLNPTEPSVHLVTARWLARNKRLSQAALEYRLARQYGGSVHPDELWASVGPKYLADAVPQTDFHLLDITPYLLRRGRPEEARAASARAVMAGGRAEASLLQRMQLAVGSKSKPFVEEAARELLELATDPSSFIAAAKGLAQIGKASAADAAIDQGLTANPHDVQLVLAGARQRLDRDDLTGAMAFMHKLREDNMTIAHRIELDELRATMAEKRGDTVTAAAMHARARNLARLAAAGAEQP